MNDPTPKPSPESMSYATAADLRRQPRPRRLLYVVAAVGVVAGVILFQPLVSLFRQAAPDSPSVPLKLPDDFRRRAVERVQPHLDWADGESKRAIEEHLNALLMFFEDVKTRTPQFAEDVLSLGSKGRLVADKLPFTRTDRHAIYLRERFDARLFTQDQLARAVESLIKNYVATVESIDGIMLVKIKADLMDFPVESLPQFASERVLEGAYLAAIGVAASKTRKELGTDVKLDVTSMIAGEVLTMAAMRLGVSGGVLGAGAASSWVTLGIGFVVGLIVDQIISLVWDWWSDPQGDLAALMNEKLDHIHRLIIEGDGTNPGLRVRLAELHREHVKARRQAITALIEGKGHP